jgi:hypothetical protein
MIMEDFKGVKSSDGQDEIVTACDELPAPSNRRLQSNSFQGIRRGLTSIEFTRV